MRYPLIIGLGNPGPNYADTRHNVGFMLLDRLAADKGAQFRSEPKWQCHLARLSCGTLLAKPQSFMNLSGRPIRLLLSFHKWSAESMLVVYDDVALPLGTLRFREKGTAGGHNGIKSIIEHTGSQSFPRLKIGIGTGAPGNLTGHVLGTFSLEERPALENTLASALEAVQVACSDGIATAANQFHQRKPQPAPKESDESQIPRPDHTRHEIPRRLD